MLQVSPVTQPKAPLQVPQEPVQQQAPIQASQERKRPRVKSKSTDFLRQRKIEKILREKEVGLYDPIPGVQIISFEELTPDLHLVENYQGQFAMLEAQNQHQNCPDRDSNLAGEYWTIQGMVNGCNMSELPSVNRHEVHSMDLIL